MKLYRTMTIILSITLIIFTYIICSQQQQLNQIVYEDTSNTTTSVTITSKSTKLPTTTLSTGRYKVGTDIAAGTYNLTAILGTGLIDGDLQEGYLSELMGISEGYEEYYSETYNNLHLKNGDEFEISGGVEIEFKPAS